MDVRQLRYFLQVLEAKSLTRAAEQLHLAQPALTLQMKKLEGDLGETLFLRHARGVVPTEAAQLLAVHARAILRQIEEARAEIGALKGEAAGTVRLGMPRSVSEMLAVDIIETARRTLPKVSIALFEQLSDDLNDALLAGRLDLIFSYNAEAMRDTIIEPVLMERLCYVTRARSKRRSVPIRFADAVRAPLILPSAPHVLRRLLEDAATRAGLSLVVAHDIDSAQLMADMVEGGLGNTILSFANVERAVKSGRLTAQRIVEPELTRRLHLVYPARRPLTHAQAAVRTLVRNCLVAYVKRHRAGLIEWTG